MRYYPRLKIFKNSTGRNEFDGHEATSYGWYVYGVLLLDGRKVRNTHSYSMATSKHIWEGMAIMGDGETLGIEAPRGLRNLDDVRSHLTYQITKLEGELANPRNRARQRRIDAIARYREMLVNCDILDADYSARAGVRGAA